MPMKGSNVILKNFVTKPSAGEVPKTFKNPNQIYTNAIIVRFSQAAVRRSWRRVLLIVTMA
jgi:hypothetical protein